MSEKDDADFYEASHRSSQTGDPGRCPETGVGKSASLQRRANFFQNWDWIFVADINRGLCERAGAIYGTSSETHHAVKAEWETQRSSEISFQEALAFLRHCHRRAPFLNFNGNTFAEIGRAFIGAALVDYPGQRAKLLVSAAGHYIAGTLDEEALTAMFESMSSQTLLKEGMSVKTLKGSLKGVVIGFTTAGNVIWQPEGMKNPLTATPESLLEDDD